MTDRFDETAREIARGIVHDFCGENGDRYIEVHSPSSGWILAEMIQKRLAAALRSAAPTWRSDQIGERMMMKLPEQFRDIFAKEQPLSEDIGAKLAAWAKGGATNTASAGAGAAVTAGEVAGPKSSDLPGDDQAVDPLLERARERADEGSAAFERWRTKLTPKQVLRVHDWQDELDQRMRAADQDAHSRGDRQEAG